MSYLIKKKKFEVEIRREKLTKELKSKRQEAALELQVNGTFRQYLKSSSHELVPQICCKFYNLIEKDLLTSWLKMQDSRMKSFLRPEKYQNVVFVSKLCLEKEIIMDQFFRDTIDQAERVNLAVQGCASQSLLITEKRNVELQLLANCLLQFWSIHIKLCHSLQNKELIVINYSISFWFNNESVYKHINKFSLCILTEVLLKFVKNQLENPRKQNSSELSSSKIQGSKYFNRDSGVLEVYGASSNIKQIRESIQKTVNTIVNFTVKILKQKKFFSPQLLAICMTLIDMGYLPSQRMELPQFTETMAGFVLRTLNCEDFYFNAPNQQNCNFFSSKLMSQTQINEYKYLSVESLVHSFCDSEKIRRLCIETKRDTLLLVQVLIDETDFMFELKESQFIKMYQSLWSTLTQFTNPQSESFLKKVVLQNEILVLFYVILKQVSRQEEWQEQSEREQHLQFVRLKEAIVEYPCFYNQEFHQFQAQKKEEMQQWVCNVSSVLNLSEMINSVRIEEGGCASAISLEVRQNLTDFLAEVQKFTPSEKFFLEVFIKGKLISKIVNFVSQFEKTLARQSVENILDNLAEMISGIDKNLLIIQWHKKDIIDELELLWDEKLTEFFSESCLEDLQSIMRNLVEGNNTNAQHYFLQDRSEGYPFKGQ